MESQDLQDLKDFWTKKYPHIGITLYPIHSDGKYRGKMMTDNESFNLLADTIGELIGQGESFLRKVRKL